MVQIHHALHSTLYYDPNCHTDIICIISLTGCKNDQFECFGELSNCIPSQFKCDGIRHCADGSDEKDCGKILQKHICRWQYVPGLILALQSIQIFSDIL